MWLQNIGNFFASYPHPYSHKQKKEVQGQGGGSVSPGVGGYGCRSRTGDRTVRLVGTELVKWHGHVSFELNYDSLRKDKREGESELGFENRSFNFESESVIEAKNHFLLVLFAKAFKHWGVQGPAQVVALAMPGFKFTTFHSVAENLHQRATRTQLRISDFTKHIYSHEKGLTNHTELLCLSDNWLKEKSSVMHVKYVYIEIFIVCFAPQGETLFLCVLARVYRWGAEQIEGWKRSAADSRMGLWICIYIQYAYFF